MGTTACQETNYNGYVSFYISPVPPTHAYYAKNKTIKKEGEEEGKTKAYFELLDGLVSKAKLDKSHLKAFYLYSKEEEFFQVFSIVLKH